LHEAVEDAEKRRAEESQEDRNHDAKPDHQHGPERLVADDQVENCKQSVEGGPGDEISANCVDRIAHRLIEENGFDVRIAEAQPDRIKLKTGLRDVRVRPHHRHLIDALLSFNR